MLVVKNLPAQAGDIRDAGSIPGSARSPGGGHGNPLQYSCPENPMDRGAWWATVRGVAKSWTQLKWLSSSSSRNIYIHTLIEFTCLLSRFSHDRFCAILWTAVCQAPLFKGFSRQEYWSGLLCLPPGDLPYPKIEPMSLSSTCIGRPVLYHYHHLGCSPLSLKSIFLWIISFGLQHWSFLWLNDFLKI